MTIELTEQQRQALETQGETPIHLVDPRNGKEFVLLRKEEYDRLKEAEYDDSPWTDEEMDHLAAEDADTLGWDGMEAYQDAES